MYYAFDAAGGMASNLTQNYTVITLIRLSHFLIGYIRAKNFLVTIHF